MPPKHQRGILGVKKDPKKQVLFSFGARQGDEWPSDDSEDTDYSPEDLTETEKSSDHAKQARLKRQKKSLKKEDTPRHELSKPQYVVADGRCWSAGLPWHVLLKIFKLIVDTDGCLPFLCRALKVCQLWRDVASSASLWSKVDLSYGWIKSTTNTLKWLCANRFSHLKSINLGTWKNLNNSDLQLLGDSCPHLQSVGLSYCQKFNADGLKILIDKCTNLTGMDLSYTAADAVSPTLLKHLIDVRGGQLTHLNLSGNTLRGFQAIFNMLWTHCPNLEELEMNKVHFSSTTLTINMEKFQEGCPKLRVLQLSLTSYRAAPASYAVKAAAPGFPNLEEVSLAIDTTAFSTVGLNDDFLVRLLKNSTKLRLLDLRGSSSIKCATLQSLAGTDLQHLYMSLSSIAKYTGIEVVMSKWQHSLKELDLSWNLYPGMSLDCAMRKLSDTPSKSVLEILNLAGTAITCDRVKSLLEGCPNLKSLNLCSCRGLPRGMKCEFAGPLLVKLRKDIDGIVAEESAALNGEVSSVINSRTRGRDP